MSKEIGVPNDANRDRPDEMDRLLRSALSSTMEPTSPSCVDAETLAAWSEGALSAEVAATVESHLSRCARCQAVAAVFAEAAPQPAAPAVVPFRPRWPLRWLVPVATAAALVVVWIAVERDDQSPLPAQTMARMEPVDAARPEASAVAPPDSELRQDLADSREQAEDLAARKSVEAQAPPPARGLDDAAGVTESAENDAARERRAATPDGLTTERAAASELARTTAVPEPTQPRAIQVAQRSAGVGGGLGGSRTTVGEAARTAEAESGLAASTAPSPLIVIEVTAGEPTVADGRLAGASRDEAQPASPASTVRWRIVDNNRVERSAGGGTWEPAFVDPSVTLTGGVAPSASVCWLIGRAGVVVLAGDGLRFERVQFPEATDLSSVRAVDARRATVTTVDNRVFTTADGGASWQVN